MATPSITIRPERVALHISEMSMAVQDEANDNKGFIVRHNGELAINCTCHQHDCWHMQRVDEELALYNAIHLVKRHNTTSSDAASEQRLKAPLNGNRGFSLMR